MIIQVLVHLHLLRFNLLLSNQIGEGDGQSEAVNGAMIKDQ